VSSTVEQVAAPASVPDGAGEWTETTRLMCAAAYLEGTFAQEVIEEIVEEPFRAVRVPEGVDIVPVVKHCLAARRQKAIRDTTLLAILVLAVVLFLSGRGLGVLFLGFLLAWAAIAVDIWIATYSVATKRLNATTFRPEDAPEPADASVRAQLEELPRRQRGNLVVYSGFNPFTSAGFDLDGWSFVIDLRKGAERLGQRAQPRPFEPHEIYDALSDSVRRLGIPGLSIDDRVFVNGSDIRDDRALLPNVVGRPASEVAPERLAEYLRTPTHRVRHYRCFRVLDWRGELVVTLFLRFSVGNGRLFAELSRFVLPPLRQEYRRIDGIDQEVTLRQMLAIARHSLSLTFPLWLRSPAAIARPLLRIQRQAKRERQVKRDYFFDYGSPTTALDRARSTQYTRYFQKLDKEMYVKLFDRTLLDGIVDFLDQHDVDTSELAERRETIINHGIMVPGGSVRAHNIAVGQNAGIINRIRGGGAGSKEG
jgi:hypothetical protein